MLMHLRFLKPALAIWPAVAAWPSSAALTPEQLKSLPAPANHAINFTKEIKPILEARCANCHGRGRDKGDFKIDSRETLFTGGGSGPAIVVGKSAESYLFRAL